MYKKLLLNFIATLLIFGRISTSTNSAIFKLGTMEDQPDWIHVSYKKLVKSLCLGLNGQSSKIQCMVVCMDDEYCYSFHLEGGACVFGVTDDVSEEISQGQTIVPRRLQGMYLKSKYLNQFGYMQYDGTKCLIRVV